MRTSVPSYYDILQVARDAPAGHPRGVPSHGPALPPRQIPRQPLCAARHGQPQQGGEGLSDPAQREQHDQWIARKEAPADPALRPAGRLSRPAPLPELPERSSRWPWVLLFGTICCAVAAVGTVLYKTELSSKPVRMAATPATPLR